MHLPSTYFDALNAQLQVPTAWVQKAKSEGHLIIRGDWHVNEFPTLVKAFNERYPYIHIDYTYGNNATRAVAPLTAFREKKFVTDIVAGITSVYPQYLQSHALSSLSSLPAWSSIPAQSKDPSGTMVDYAVKFWGIGYNPQKISAQQLPKTWDEVLTDPAFRNGKLAIGDRPELFMNYLAGVKGSAWANQFMKSLFDTVKPQLRNEGMDALPQLVANGTYDAVLPSAGYTIVTLKKKGAPLAWYSPEPIPADQSDIELMSNAKDPYAAKIFINWLLSSEGQVADVIASKVSPIRPNLQKYPQLFAVPQVLGKKWAPLSPTQDLKILPPLEKTWKQYWQGNG